MVANNVQGTSNAQHSAPSQVQQDSGRLMPTPFQRVMFVGTTGSGKSYAARAILRPHPRLIVCDVTGAIEAAQGTEDDWHIESWKTGYKKLAEGKAARVLIPAQNSLEDWETYFWQVYKLRGVTLYIDELFGVRPQQNRALKALLTRGRHRKIGVWSSMQRPSSVPLEVLTETEWKIMFQLRLKDDIDRMVYLMNGDERARRPLRDHALYVYNDKTGLLRFSRINDPNDIGVTNNV